MNDAAQISCDIKHMRKTMRDTKGVSNFRNLFMYAPNGKTDGINILPLSEVAMKNDFLISKRPAVMTCWPRTGCLQMMGIISDNAGAGDDVVKAVQVFVRNELTPLQESLKEINN